MYRKQISGYQGRGRGNTWMGNGEAQTTGCKIVYKDVLYNMGTIANNLLLL